MPASKSSAFADLITIPEQDEIQTIVTMQVILSYRDEGINAFDDTQVRNLGSAMQSLIATIENAPANWSLSRQVRQTIDTAALISHHCVLSLQKMANTAQVDPEGRIAFSPPEHTTVILRPLCNTPAYQISPELRVHRCFGHPFSYAQLLSAVYRERPRMTAWFGLVRAIWFSSIPVDAPEGSRLFGDISTDSTLARIPDLKGYPATTNVPGQSESSGLRSALVIVATEVGMSVHQGTNPELKPRVVGGEGEPSLRGALLQAGGVPPPDPRTIIPPSKSAPARPPPELEKPIVKGGVSLKAAAVVPPAGGDKAPGQEDIDAYSVDDESSEDYESEVQEDEEPNQDILAHRPITAQQEARIKNTALAKVHQHKVDEKKHPEATHPATAEPAQKKRKVLDQVFAAAEPKGKSNPGGESTSFRAATSPKPPTKLFRNSGDERPRGRSPSRTPRRRRKRPRTDPRDARGDSHRGEETGHRQVRRVRVTKRVPDRGGHHDDEGALMWGDDGATATAAGIILLRFGVEEQKARDGSGRASGVQVCLVRHKGRFRRSFPKGRIRTNRHGHRIESADQCRFRELWEETGMQRKYVHEFGHFSVMHHNVHYVSGIYCEPGLLGNCVHSYESWAVEGDNDIDLASWISIDNVSQAGYLNQYRSEMMMRAVQEICNDDKMCEVMLYGFGTSGEYDAKKSFPPPAYPAAPSRASRESSVVIEELADSKDNVVTEDADEPPDAGRTANRYFKDSRLRHTDDVERERDAAAGSQRISKSLERTPPRMKKHDGGSAPRGSKEGPAKNVLMASPHATTFVTVFPGHVPEFKLWTSSHLDRTRGSREICTAWNDERGCDGPPCSSRRSEAKKWGKTHVCNAYMPNWKEGEDRPVVPPGGITLEPIICGGDHKLSDHILHFAGISKGNGKYHLVHPLKHAELYR